MARNVEERVKIEIEGREYEIGSEQELVDKIRERAKELGMKRFFVRDQDGNKLYDGVVTLDISKITLEKLPDM